MTDLPPHRYVKTGVESGHDEETVQAASKQIRTMAGRGIVPILSLGHLAHLTGAPYGFLRSITERSTDPYVDIVRPKRSGGDRHLSSPLPHLMGVQRWILDQILDQITIHPASFAYQRNRSTLMCAQEHVGATWLLKLDLHDFFPEIHEPRVFRVFESLGYSRLMSLELSRICTRLKDLRWARTSREYTTIGPYANKRIGCLPQGAPTSGALANAVATVLDADLSQFALENSLVYTRYSDDLAFSSCGTFNRKAAASLISRIEGIIVSNRFTIHKKKTRLVPPGSRKVILGLLLGEDGVRLLPEFRRRIEVHLRGVSNFGLPDHAEHRRFDSIIGFVNHVDGLISYAIGIEKEFGRTAQDEWNRILDSHGEGIFNS